MWSSTPFLFARVFVILSFHTEHWDFEKLRLAFTSCSFPHKRSYSQPVSSFHLMPMAFYIPEFRFLTLAVWDLLPSFLPEPFASFLLLSKQQLVTYAGHSYACLCLGVSWQGLFWALIAIWGVIVFPTTTAQQDRGQKPQMPDLQLLKPFLVIFVCNRMRFVVVLVISFLFPISELKFPRRTFLSFCLWREVG